MSPPTIPQDLLDGLNAAQQALTAAQDLDAARARTADELAAVQEQDSKAQAAALAGHVEANGKALSAIEALRQHFGVADASTGPAAPPPATFSAPGQADQAAAPPPATPTAQTYMSPVAKKRAAAAQEKKV